MKKLIEELEKLSRVSPSLTEWGEGYIPGVMDALQIVKSYDPWIDVTELPPGEEEPEFGRNLSVTVLACDGDNNYVDVGWYDFDLGVWENLEITPTHWTYLPEQPK